MTTRFEERDFPIVRIRPEGRSTDADMRDRLAFVERQLERDGNFAVVFDSRRSALLSSAHRRMWSEWIARHEEDIRDRISGVAVLVSSAATRAVFTAVFWLRRPPTPIVFVESDAEAELALRRFLGHDRYADA